MNRPPDYVHRAATEEVELQPYDPDWPLRFQAEADFLRRHLPASAIGRIEHFGSTAIPGMSAKPIIDMLVEVPSLRTMRSVIAPILQEHGYEYFWRPSWNDPFVIEYAWFIKRDAGGRRTHHVHMLEPDSRDWERLQFRDYLIDHPELAREYAQLKERILHDAPHDRLAYARAKTEFIQRVTAVAKLHYRRRNGG